MANLTEITLQLIHQKLDEIFTEIKGKNKLLTEHDVFIREKKPITQDQFNTVMDEVMKVVNKKSNE